MTKPTINQCKSRGNQFFEGYKKAAPKKADSGTAHKIQYSKLCVALTKGTNNATSKYKKIRFQLLRACINWRRKFC